MKIYLYFKNEGWKLVEAKDKELKKLLNERNIIIFHSARIGDYTTIGHSARMDYFVTIGNFVTIGDYAKIGYYVKIGNSSTIGDYAKIGYYVTIGNFVSIGDYATISDYAKISDYTRIGNEFNKDGKDTFTE